MTRVIVAGSRDFNNYNQLTEALDMVMQVYEDVELISGGANGADTLAERYAKEHDIPIKVFHADWDSYGRSAGIRRNADMAKYASETEGVLIAFWDGLSRGTKAMIDIACKYGLEVYVINF